MALLTLQKAIFPAVATRALRRPLAVSGSRFFSADSHDDFKPQKTSVDKHVKTFPILLYMKGTPHQPQCGFSQRVVRILHATGCRLARTRTKYSSRGLGCDFDSVNVLEHPEIREGVKKYS
jgi:monothiol glutaredoxin